MTAKKRTFESALQRIEEIVQQLESGEIALEESMKVFEEGGELVRYCMSQLEEAEQKIQKLKTDEKGELQLELL